MTDIEATRTRLWQALDDLVEAFAEVDWENAGVSDDQAAAWHHASALLAESPVTAVKTAQMVVTVQGLRKVVRELTRPTGADIEAALVAAGIPHATPLWEVDWDAVATELDRPVLPPKREQSVTAEFPIGGTPALDDRFGDSARLAQLVYAITEGKFTEALNLAQSFSRDHDL